MKTCRIILAAGVLALLSVPAPADARTSIGTTVPDGTAGTACSAKCQFVEDDATSRITANGVVTEWFIGTGTTAGSTARILVFRPTATPSVSTLVSRSEPIDVPAGTPFPRLESRIPLRAGDRLGLELVGAGDPVAVSGTTGQVRRIQTTLTAPGESTGTDAEALVGALNLVADVEPDADGDGFGDESQDLCPADAARQAPCPPAPATPAGPQPAAAVPPVALPSTPVLVKPRVTGLKVTKDDGRHVVRFTLSRAAKVRLVFRRCLDARCTRTRVARTLTVAGRRGANRRVLGGARLARGAYRLQVHSEPAGERLGGIAWRMK